MRRTTMDKLSSWKIWLVVAGCLVLAYLVAALTVLPQWLVSQNLGGVDANTRLNAITATRVALLGILTPVVIAIAGVVAALGYGETVRHNRRTDELARRQHRADANTDLLVAWDECMTAASTLCHGGSPDPDERLLQWQALFAKRVAVDRATDRATLFSAESVRTTARALEPIPAYMSQAGSSEATEVSSRPRPSGIRSTPQTRISTGSLWLPLAPIWSPPADFLFR